MSRLRGKCTLEGCERPHYGKGLCRAHYKRKARHGDPLGGEKPRGYVPKWIREVAIPFQGDECLTFPFFRDAYGYGRVHIEGRAQPAHAYVLRCIAGPKPTPKHECCHTCGNGHLGCVNPKHLYWGTRSQNVQDAIRHGTFDRSPRPKGSDSPRARYTAEQVRRAVALVRGGVKQAEAVRITGVRQQTISRAMHGQGWVGFV